jgi:hypothetical protein
MLALAFSVCNAHITLVQIFVTIDHSSMRWVINNKSSAFGRTRNPFSTEALSLPLWNEEDFSQTQRISINNVSISWQKVESSAILLLVK